MKDYGASSLDNGAILEDIDAAMNALFETTNNRNILSYGGSSAPNLSPNEIMDVMQVFSSENVAYVERALAPEDNASSASGALPSAVLNSALRRIDPAIPTSTETPATLGETVSRANISRPISVPSRQRYVQISARRSRETEQDPYFDSKTETLSSGQMVTHYECQKCEEKVSASKPRNKVFHLIKCSELNDKKRFAFYIKCDDKQKSPPVARPFKGLTLATARRLVREKETEIQKIAEDIANKSNDFSHDHACARYIVAVAEQKGSTKISQCSNSQQDFATSLLVRLIIDENLPFSICDNRQHGRPRLLKLLLSYLRPGFKMPFGHKIRGELLDKYYADTVSKVKTEMRKLLRFSRATIMFDGSTDVNSAPMVNILVRLTGRMRMESKTFFLTTVYTGYDTCTADYYVEIVENVNKEFGLGHALAVVVTDKTSSVRNAREIIERKYGRAVVSQDQAHAADKLLEDFGEMSWIKGVLGKVSNIGSDIGRCRKL